MSRGTLDQNLKTSIFVYRPITFYGVAFQLSSTNSCLLLCSVHNPKVKDFGLGSFHFARRYSGNRFFFLFLRVLRCFSSPGLPPYTYVFSIQYLTKLSRFPHSEIFGSQAMCAYPKLIAAYHVLHRLLVPRHSPCALCSLTLKVSINGVLRRQFNCSAVLTY